MSSDCKGMRDRLENIINSFVRGWNRTTNMELNADNIQDVTYKIPFTLLCNSYLGIVVMYCEQGRGGAPDTSISLSLSINTESQRNIFNINAINFSFRFNK